MSAPVGGTRPLKVLYLMHTTAPGGAAGSLRYLIEHFPPGAVDATVLCPDGPITDLLRASGIKVRLIPGVSMFLSIAGVPLRGLRLAELARTAWLTSYGDLIQQAITETRPDLVHLNDRGMFHAARIAHRGGIPVVMHARSVADRTTPWVRWLSSGLTLRYVDRVLAIDQSVRHSLREIPNVDVIYNPLAAAPVRGATEHGKAPPGGSPATIQVAYLTGLLAFKGIWDLLAAARLLRHRREIQFLIAGGNSRPDAFHRSLRGKFTHLLGFAPDVERAARAWVAREGLEGTIRLLGHVERTDALLSQADILVFPSHLNGPGRSVFEAGVHGIPAVVAMKDRIEDVVVDGLTGLIVPERDPGRLAEAIVRLVDDPGLRLRLGDNARARYVSQFEPRAVALQVLEVYRRVLASRSSAAQTSGSPRVAVPA